MFRSVCVLCLLLCGLNFVFIVCSQYKLHRVNATNRKFTPYKSNNSTYVLYNLNIHSVYIKNILIHNGIHLVLQNSHYHMLTSTHQHTHAGKTSRIEHGDLLNMLAVAYPQLRYAHQYGNNTNNPHRKTNTPLPMPSSIFTTVKGKIVPVLN
jgi:hypothetical protein